MDEHIYETKFRLVGGEVNDRDEANYFLTHPDMTKYLKEDESIPNEVREAVEHIEWWLINSKQGYVTIKTNRKMSKEELLEISYFVKGENGDGLGESFEQRDFANWARFDFKTNKYIFKEVR